MYVCVFVCQHLLKKLLNKGDILLHQFITVTVQSLPSAFLPVVNCVHSLSRIFVHTPLVVVLET